MNTEKVKKIWINSSLFDCTVSVGFVFALVFGALEYNLFYHLNYSIFQSILFGLLTGCLFCLFFIWIMYKILKKYKKVIILSNDAIIYEEKKETYKIWICNIKKLLYKEKQLVILMNDDTTYHYDISRFKAKKIANYVSLELNYKKRNIKGNIRLFFVDLKHNIIKYKDKILLGLIGLLLTILSFILFLKFNYLLYIKIILVVVCGVYGIFQFFYYFKRSNAFAAIMSFIIFELLTFCGLLLLFMAGLKKGFNVDYIFYTIFLTPSFVLVIVAAVLALMVIGG